MSPLESFFSCLKQEETLRYATPPPPPQASAVPKPEENFVHVLKTLEARIFKQEENAIAVAAALRDSLAEVQACRSESRQTTQRVQELEGRLVEFASRLKTAPAAAASDPEMDTVIAGLRTELSTYSRRLIVAEDALDRLETEGLNSVPVEISLLEGRMKSLESCFTGEIHARFSELGGQVLEVKRQTCLAMEATASGARRLDKLEESAARLPYLERRLSSIESKLERLYDLDALAQSLKLHAEGMEEKIVSVMKEHAIISGGQSELSSNFDSLSAQIRQMSALFNQFRTELAFLIPKKRSNTVG